MFRKYPQPQRLPVCAVIPTLNAEAGLRSTLAAVTDVAAHTIVVDGGSTDATMTIATEFGAQLIHAPRGRGQQLAAGAAAAMQCHDAPWLLFLHADTVPQPPWAEAVGRHVALPANQSRAAAFRFELDDRSPAARRLERAVEWRCRWLALPYGDQGLLIHRLLYRAVGGYRPLPLMEDVDIIHRIGRKRLIMLEASARTSAVRYRRTGYWRRSARNTTLLALYFLGVPPDRLARWYA